MPQGGPLSAVDAASSHCTPQMGKLLGTATGHRLGISKCFGGIPEVRYGGAL